MFSAVQPVSAFVFLPLFYHLRFVEKMNAWTSGRMDAYILYIHRWSFHRRIDANWFLVTSKWHKKMLKTNVTALSWAHAPTVRQTILKWFFFFRIGSGYGSTETATKNAEVIARPFVRPGVGVAKLSKGEKSIQKMRHSSAFIRQWLFAWICRFSFLRSPEFVRSVQWANK